MLSISTEQRVKMTSDRQNEFYMLVRYIAIGTETMLFTLIIYYCYYKIDKWDMKKSLSIAEVVLATAHCGRTIHSIIRVVLKIWLDRLHLVNFKVSNASLEVHAVTNSTRTAQGVHRGAQTVLWLDIQWGKAAGSCSSHWYKKNNRALSHHFAEKNWQGKSCFYIHPPLKKFSPCV